MNIKIFYYLTGLGTLIALMGCTRKSEGSDGVEHAVRTNSANNTATPSASPKAAESVGGNESQKIIDQLALKVQGIRTGSQGRDAIIAMHQLLSRWSPTEKNIAEVKSMLGKPSEESVSSLVYRFDDQDQAYEWTLAVERDVVKSITLVLRE